MSSAANRNASTARRRRGSAAGNPGPRRTGTAAWVCACATAALLAACSTGATPRAGADAVADDTMPFVDAQPVDAVIDGTQVDVPDAADTADAADADAIADPAADDAPANELDDGEAEAGCATHDDCVGKVGVLGPCEVARCQGGACVKGSASNQAPCDDANACTGNDRCQAGACAGSDLACDDHNDCTVDSCDKTAGCQHSPIAGPCDDHDPCTTTDVCAGSICAGQPVSCDDGNPCTVDACGPDGTCRHADLVAGACDDASVCTTGDRCSLGKCSGDARDCDDHNVCTLDGCDAVSGCTHPAQVASKCDDGRACTRDDRCAGDGTCAGAAIDCDDGDPCTDDLCCEANDGDPRCGGRTGCAHVAGSAPCDDRNECTVNDRCAAGLCAGDPILCDAPPANECLPDGVTMASRDRRGLCVGGQCTYGVRTVPCAAGCAGGLCIGDPCAGLDCASPPGPCFGAGVCVAGSCDFPFAPEGGACDDGRACTLGDACRSGVCAGAPRVCNQPPAPTCQDLATLRWWNVGGNCDEAAGCTYAAHDSVCGTCIGGTCLDGPAVLDSQLDPGGLASLKDAVFGGACVLPGWHEAERLATPSFWMVGGFEP